MIRDAFAEARDSISISLNHALGLTKIPTGRSPTTHRVLSWAEDMAPAMAGHICSLDDEISFNTQASSQWDGFFHYAHQASGFGYNGVRVTTKGSMPGDSDETRVATQVSGMEGRHTRGGVVGRGVLLDYRAYATENGTEYNACSRHAITVQDFENIAKFQGSELKRGDILIIRSGIAEDMEGLGGE